MVRLPKPKPSQRPSADEVPSASAHSTTDSGRPSHSASPSRSVAAARGWIAVGGGRDARTTSSSPKISSSRVLCDDGLITSRGFSIGHAPRTARVRDVRRRGRSGGHALLCQERKILETPISHKSYRLPSCSPPFAHVVAVVLAHQRVGSIAGLRRLPPARSSGLAAVVRAVDLTPVVGGTDVRQLRAPVAPEFSEALVAKHRVRRARTRAETCAGASGTTRSSVAPSLREGPRRSPRTLASLTHRLRI